MTVAVEEKLNAIHDDLVKAVDGIATEEVNVKCAGLEASLAILSAPLEHMSGNVRGATEGPAEHNVSSLDEALQCLARVVTEQKQQFDRLALEHAATTKEIDKSFDTIAGLVSPSPRDTSGTLDDNLLEQLRQNVQQMLGEVQAIEVQSLAAVEEQKKVEDRERRKIDGMLQRLWET